MTRMFLACIHDGYELGYLQDLTEFINWERDQLMSIMSDKKTGKNPILKIVQDVIMSYKDNAELHDRKLEIFLLHSNKIHSIEEFRTLWRAEDNAILLLQMRISGDLVYSERLNCE